jgi:hypothetical protein
VGFASSRVASLIGGTMILYDSYLSRTQLAGMAARLFPAWASSHGFSRELFAVLEMTREMVAMSHGGTILVVPAGPLERIYGLRLPPRYAVPRPALSFLSRLADVPRPAQDASIAPIAVLEDPELDESDTRHELRDAARVIAHLTAVDGAVVITEGLDLLAFGVMIDVAPSTTPVELPTIDPAAPAKMGSRTQQEFGGARHQSAIAFCRAQPASALALVVSRDGTLSAFLRDSHTVLAIRPLDVGLARFGGRL